MYYVRLKQNHQLTPEQANAVRKMELKTPEERWPFPKDAEGSHLIEIYKKGTFEECEAFISEIKDKELAAKFETFLWSK